MSGRIRTIKPEILDDVVTAGLSHEAFRLFVAMIVLADDYGNLRASPSMLDGQIFHTTQSQLGIQALLRELSTAKVEESDPLIHLYGVKGQLYAHIKGWSKHQKVDRPGKARIPAPDDSDIGDKRPAGDWLYFIQRSDSKSIKIGRSWNPETRLKDLQQACDCKLTLLLKVPGGYQERPLQLRFKESRLKGEWFQQSDELLEVIEQKRLVYERELDESRIIRDHAANDSRTVRDHVATDLDLRPHTSDLRPVPPTSEEGSPKKEAQKCARSEPTRTSVSEPSASHTETALFEFPCRGDPPRWPLTAEQAARWAELYPGIDVVSVCRKALAWSEASPRKRKTASRMKSWLVSVWLNEAADRPMSDRSPQQRPPVRRRPSREEELMQLALEAQDREISDEPSSDRAASGARRLPDRSMPRFARGEA